MRLFTLAAMAASAAAFGLGSAARPTFAAQPPKLSGPFVHDNLTVYFIHGASANGPVPLTLAEALAKGTVRVDETGSVNSLDIENTGTEDVFIQAGDIVKGGQQDRVLMMSMVLPQKSGRLPIGSFCVEQGRWSKRGSEDVKRFSSATEALPSREAKLAMQSPAKTSAPQPPTGNRAGGSAQQAAAGSPRHADDTGARQHEVWAAVAGVQGKLSARLGAPVAAPQSASSLQLSLENDRLRTSRAAYISDLEGKATADDIVGYVFAVDGKINSADQYPSNGLFKKMWPKLLAASATEAIGEAARSASAAHQAPVAPSRDDVEAFLLKAQNAQPHAAPVGTFASQELRDTDTVLYVEARKADGTWVHRNYLAK